MRIRPFWILALCVITTSAFAQPYTAPIGIGLETWPSPYPLQYLPLEIEGQKLNMAYMDVQPRDDAKARTVVLLHGKNFFGAYWGDVAADLVKHGYRVVIPDQIGFGHSSKPNIHYSFDLLAQNTAALLDHLKIDKAAIVGHSMGGMLAVRFVRNYPQRATHLILENPIGLEDYRMKVPPRPFAKTYENELGQNEERIRKYYKTYFVNWKPEYEKLIEPQIRATLSPEFPRWAMASALTYGMIYQQPVRHEFSLIQTPTLLIIGQSDRTTIGCDLVSKEVLATLGNYPELGRAAHKDIANSQLIEIPNCGHIPHLEATGQFLAEVRRFLK
jgi:pimeloyl-ACP methyl ester carboxylesterase